MGGGGGGRRGGKGGGGGVPVGHPSDSAANQQQWQHTSASDRREEIKNFLGFYKRKDSVCIELYQPEFYRKKPTWEDMALFVSQQLCQTAELRSSLKDIQLHPVKKHLFIKFRNTISRDQVAVKLKTGVEWPAFEAKVHGWGMDKPVIVVRLHGVSPESTKKDIEDVMSQYGDILDIDIGYISKKLLPRVTNGMWTVKMIMLEGKVLPSFVFMKEEGEVWQVTHESQVNVCWKCGNGGHIGSKCNHPSVTFDALEKVQATAVEVGDTGAEHVRSWAHVVRAGPSMNELQIQEDIMKRHEETEIRKDEAAAKVVATKEAAAKEAAAKEAAAKGAGAAKEAAAKEAAAKKAAIKEAAAKEAASKEVVAKVDTDKEAAAKKAAAKGAAAKESTAKETATKDSAAKEGATEESVANVNFDQGATANEVTVKLTDEETAAKDVAAGRAAIKRVSVEGAGADITASGGVQKDSDNNVREDNKSLKKIKLSPSVLEDSDSLYSELERASGHSQGTSKAGCSPWDSLCTPMAEGSCSDQSEGSDLVAGQELLHHHGQPQGHHEQVVVDVGAKQAPSDSS